MYGYFHDIFSDNARKHNMQKKRFTISNITDNSSSLHAKASFIKSCLES